MILYDVFLSYRREDGEALADALYNYLTAKGLRVFFDRKKMVDGHYFDTQIRTALNQAPNYVLLATPKVFPFREGEDWVREEINLALKLYDREQENRTFTVLALPDAVFPEQMEKLKFPNRIPQAGGALEDESKRRLLKAVTQINRRNLWHAAHNWWEESQKTGRRFAGLSIDQAIMPQARPKEQRESRFPIDVYQKDRESTSAPTPLLEALKVTEGHLYLIGQGGIGKTTALMRIMEMAYQNKVYSETDQIPIFVELSRAPDTDGKLYDGTGSTFIRRAVYQQVRRDRKVKQVAERAVEEVEDVFSIDPETVVEPVNDLFTQKTPAPEYLLLLDGLNEVSRTEVNGHYPVITRIIQEIQWLMTNCPNVRVILTSRTDEEAVFHEGMTRLYLSEIKRETIADYLTRNGRPPEETAALLEDEKLAETLGVPLFLTLYATLKDTRNVTSRGEIFRTVFHEREEGLGTYTVQGRAARVEQDVAESASLQSSLRVTAKMQSFMLDFLLPEIAWEMERREVFYLEEYEIEEIITPVLTGTGDKDICGKHGRMLFKKYREGDSARAHTKKTAKQLMELGNEDPEEATELVIDTCLLSLGILQANNGKYGFLHHHIRDYFAAVRNVNSLRMAVYLGEHGGPAMDCLKDWRDRPVSPEVRRFVGEILGEHHNVPVCVDGTWRYNVPKEPSGRNLIERVLDLYHGRFGGEDGYALYSLTSILKDVRGDLSGMDLSRLDLSHCIFNGIPLGRINLATKICNAKFTVNTIFPMGHTGGINILGFNLDGKMIVTSSTEDQTTRIWDASTGICLLKIIGILSGAESIYSCIDKFRIVTIYNDSATIWEASTGTVLLSLDDQIKSAKFSPDGKWVVTISLDNTAKIWDLSTGKCHLILRGDKTNIKERTKEEIVSARYNPDGSHIATISRMLRERTPFEGEINLWKNRNKYLNLMELPHGRTTFEVTSYAAKVWDAKTGKVLLSLADEYKGFVNSVTYSPNGGKIVTTFDFDSTAQIWNASTGKLICTLDLETSPFQNALHAARLKNTSSLAFNPNGNRIVTSADQTARIWEPDTGECLNTLKGHTDNVLSISYSPDGRRIVTASNDGTAIIWDANTGVRLHTLKEISASISFALYSPNGRRIITVSEGTAVIWDAETGVRILELQGYSGTKKGPKWDPAKKHPMTVQLDKTARIWDVTLRRCLCTLTGHTDMVEDVSCNRDGSRVVTASKDRTAKIWDLITGECLLGLSGHTGGVYSASYSPFDDRIITTSEDTTAKIWDATTGKCLLTLEGHSRCVTLASYSSDGTQIVTVSNDGTSKIWDASTGECLLTLEGHNREVELELNGCNAYQSHKTSERSYSLSIVPGLIVHGVDFRNLHPDSRFSEEEKELLRRYGAIVDDTDT